MLAGVRDQVHDRTREQRVRETSLRLARPGTCLLCRSSTVRRCGRERKLEGASHERGATCRLCERHRRGDPSGDDDPGGWFLRPSKHAGRSPHDSDHGFRLREGGNSSHRECGIDRLDRSRSPVSSYPMFQRGARRSRVLPSESSGTRPRRLQMPHPLNGRTPARHRPDWVRTADCGARFRRHGTGLVSECTGLVGWRMRGRGMGVHGGRLLRRVQAVPGTLARSKEGSEIEFTDRLK